MCEKRKSTDRRTFMGAAAAAVVATEHLTTGTTSQIHSDLVPKTKMSTT